MDYPFKSGHNGGGKENRLEISQSFFRTGDLSFSFSGPRAVARTASNKGSLQVPGMVLSKVSRHFTESIRPE